MSSKLRQKVALITGSKEGIGFQTALQLARRNWTVLLADKQSLEKTKATIIKQSFNTDIHSYHLDLSSFKSVRNFAKDIIQSYDHLNVIINNAGIFQSNELETVDGICPVMQVNYLGPFLLTSLLTGLLKKAQYNSRIIFVASSGAFLHTLNRKTLPCIKQPNSINVIEATLAYYNSKLCTMIITKGFAKRLAQFHITANCVHPGMTNSNFLIKGASLRYVAPLAHLMINLVTQDVIEASEKVTFLATSETVSQVTGKYFVNYQPSEMPKLVLNCDYCKMVWRQAEKTVGFTVEEKMFLNN